MKIVQERPLAVLDDVMERLPLASYTAGDSPVVSTAGLKNDWVWLEDDITFNAVAYSAGTALRYNKDSAGGVAGDLGVDAALTRALTLGSAVDHGAMTGLGDDDHLQYLNESRADALYYPQADVDTAINAKETAFAKNTGFNLALGATVGTVAQGNDSRFTDARTPTAHTHTKSEITDFTEADYATGAEGDLAATALQDITGLALNTLANVASTAPTDGQVLTFDTVNGWQPEALPAGGAEINDLTAAVTWTNVPDSNITASSVTQHTAAVVTTLAVTTAGALMDSEVDTDLKTLSLPASTTISAFGATLVDDASSTAARATLGVSIGSQVQAYNAALTGTTGTYTSANATKLSGIATAATANSTNAVLLARANHTGTQTLATLSDVPTTQPIATQSYWTGTQAAYDLLTPDANTLYLIEVV